jgi:hypothetical protein
MFPCWTLDELSVAAQNDPGMQLDLDEVADQFHQFGGIIRHVLATKEQRASFVFKDDQTNKVSGCDPASFVRYLPELTLIQWLRERMSVDTSSAIATLKQRVPSGSGSRTQN